VIRVHGPFIDDDEVAKVVEHLKKQGEPEYLTAVTTNLEEEDFSDACALSGDDQLYKNAIAAVKESGKVSISYVQRALRIGYNRAATLVEKMEKDGVVSAPNHQGKRELLIE